MTMPRQWRLREELHGLPAYRAGSAGPDTRFKVSSNEDPAPPTAIVRDAGAAALARANRYPDIAATALVQALAEDLGVQQDQVAVGNGSVALLQQAVQMACSPGDEVVYAWRSFEAYPIITQIAGAVSRAVPVTDAGEHDLDAMAEAVGPRTRVVLLCTPNNPTGPALPAADVRAFLRLVPSDVVVVLDEAYREYVIDPAMVDGLDMLAEHPNLVTMRTFSKAYGLAGLRVGYAVGQPSMMAAIRSMGVPFGVSGVAQACALAAWHDSEQMRGRVSRTLAERERVMAAIGDVGLTVPAPEGNFVWFAAGDAAEAVGARCAQAGVAVRVFPGEGIRVTIAEPAANDILVELVRDGVLAATG